LTSFLFEERISYRLTALPLPIQDGKQ